MSQGVVYINDNAKIITSDIECSNGVVHFIDKVLFPYELTGKADINTDVCNSTNEYHFLSVKKLIKVSFHKV